MKKRLRYFFLYLRVMKIYADTSFISGCFDEEFQLSSNNLFNEFIYGNEILMLSSLTLQELELAREEVRNKILEVYDSNIILNTL